MAASFSEIPESRSYTMSPPTVTTKWVCEGEHDSAVVSALALSGTPITFSHPLGILWRQDVQVEEIGNALYNWTIPYAQQKRQTGSYRVDFDTMGGTIHIQAGVHQDVYPSSKPTHDGLIGVKGDDVEGVDVIIPAMRIIVHFKHPAGVITVPQMRVLSRLTGSVSNTPFLGWASYETLFLGAQGSEGSDVETEISYHFGMSENQTGLSIGGITGIAKAGWDVAWVSWTEAVEESKSAPKADYVNVVRVYKERDLATTLGFGA